MMQCVPCFFSWIDEALRHARFYHHLITGLMMQEGGIPVRALFCATVLAAAPVALHVVQAPCVCWQARVFAAVRLYARLPVKIQD